MEVTKTVKYIAQETEATCWKAAYKMMLNYKSGEQAESKANNLPNDAQMRERGILDSEFPACRGALGLSSSTYKAFLTADGIKEKLETYGPIWVSGDYCEGKYKHIVILCGIRDHWVDETEVMINDPWSGFKHGLNKPRWIPLSRFTDRMNKVSFACQHWF